MTEIFRRMRKATGKMLEEGYASGEILYALNYEALCYEDSYMSYLFKLPEDQRLAETKGRLPYEMVEFVRSQAKFLYARDKVPLESRGYNYGNYLEGLSKQGRKGVSA